MIRVLFVCLGNICRSPLAEGLFKAFVEERKLSQHISCDSCGTASYHIGNQPDKRTVKNAKSHGIILDHKARPLHKTDYSKFDYIVCMDRTIYNTVMRLKPSQASCNVVLMRHYDEYLKDMDEVPDPYYGTEEDFEGVYLILESCTRRFLDSIQKEKGLDSAS